MSTATTSLPTPTEKRPGIRKIMTWNSKHKDKKHAHLFGYDSAPEDEEPAPSSVTSTPSLKNKSGRPSLFAVFARRNSTRSLSEHSSRSLSPISPRPSTEYQIPTDGFRTPSPTPSRNSMIFERDIESHENLSAHEAIDLAIPPVLDDAAEAFASDEIQLPTIITKNGHDSYNEDNSEGQNNPWAHNPLGAIDSQKRISGIFVDYANVWQPIPVPFEQKATIAETLRATSPREMNELTGVKETNGIHENSWKS
ncbi:hypothetical protein G9A89_017956 [Geosiphon pyriformis]|nr:hypothetical protein G9A89_017956 [Geosiphon pyriformis]